ncbi:MAG TPA: CSLREA domain-containing protein, partial [Acidimicrobiales bacterium]|nr:CSLREA domain-containing protein [Acidimicrobiales bacterium]
MRSVLRLGVGGLLLGSVLGFGAVLLHAGAASAAGPFTVNTTTDEHLTTSTSTTCVSPSGCSLRAAIEAANNAGGSTTINVPAGTFSLSLGELRVGTYPGSQSSYAITIVGAGAASSIVNQTDGSNRVFDLDPNLHGSVDITINGLKITGGHDAADTFGGAGIIGGFEGLSGNTNPDNTILTNCTIDNNHTSSATATNRPGGGVQYIGGNLTITNCTISSNSSGSSEGGGVFYDSHSPANGTLTVTGSTFSSNTLTNTSAVFVGGAGLKVKGITGAHYLVDNTQFVSNTATGTGTGPVGGGAISSNQGDLQVTHSTFTGNHADGANVGNAGGGAINVAAGGDASTNFFVHFNRIVGNSATNGPSGVFGVSGLDFTDNWWGCNTGPGTTGCDGATGPTVAPRIVLTNAPNPATIRVGDTSTLTADFLHDSGNNPLTTANISALIGLPVAWAAPDGGSIAGGAQTTIQSNGKATATFNPTTFGVFHPTAKVDNGTASATVTVLAPPSISKAFNAPSFPLNGDSTLTFTITNPNTANGLSGLAFTDNFPAHMKVAGTPGVLNNCNGTFTATSGSSSVSLSGGTINANTTCTVSVHVTSDQSGSVTNQSGNVSATDAGGLTGNTATASVTVVSPPTITKSFNPTSIPLNGTSTLSLLITNPNNNSISLSGIAFTDSLPSGMVVNATTNLSNTCGGTATATAGSSSVSLTGGTLAAGANCTVSAVVKGTSAGALANSSGPVTATESGSASNSSSATLTVVAPPTIAKAFSPSTIPLGGTSSLG